MRPLDLLRNLQRDYVQQASGCPRGGHRGHADLVTDPDQALASRVVQNVFPKATPVFCVTTHLEFMQTVAQFFGGSAMTTPQ